MLFVTHFSEAIPNTMPQTYKRKTDRVNVPLEIRLQAVKMVLNDKVSCNSAAKAHGIPETSLRRYCMKYRESINNDAPLESVGGYKSSKKVFNDTQEQLLRDYLLKASAMYFGLSYYEARKLACEYALQLRLPGVPDNWSETGCAGKGWMQGFMRRHPALSLRSPEATSMSRVTSFNRHNVKCFYDNYTNLLTRTSVPPERIWNVDETGIQRYIHISL